MTLRGGWCKLLATELQRQQASRNAFTESVGECMKYGLHLCPQVGLGQVMVTSCTTGNDGLFESELLLGVLFYERP